MVAEQKKNKRFVKTERINIELDCNVVCVIYVKLSKVQVYERTQPGARHIIRSRMEKLTIQIWHLELLS